MEIEAHQIAQSEEVCFASVSHILDAFYVLGGKWKMVLIFSLIESSKRFNELQKILKEIGPKMLAKDLKELELNEFIVRRVYPGVPARIVYQASPYSHSLSKLLAELRHWGYLHRERIKQSMRKVPNHP